LARRGRGPLHHPGPRRLPYPSEGGPGLRDRSRGGRPDPRAEGHPALGRPLRRPSDPRHPPLPGPGRLGAPLSGPQRRPRVSARLHGPGRHPAMTVFLLDIEGTTTPIDFVTKTLFPFARRHVKAFVAGHRDAVRDDLARLRAEIAEEKGAPPWREDEASVEA